MNYFNYIEKKKLYYLNIEKSLQTVLEQVKSKDDYQEFVINKQLRLINENFDMNVDYDTKDLDRQKMKIDKMIEALERYICEPKVEVKIFETKDWSESFQMLLKAVQKADVQKKYEIKMHFKTMVNSKTK